MSRSSRSAPTGPSCPISPVDCLLDTPPEASFDRLTRLAAVALDAPRAFISIATPDRLYFKSAFGMPAAGDGCGPDTAQSICRHTVHSGEPLLIGDVRASAPEPATTGVAIPCTYGPGVAAYAAMPLRDAAGATLGCLCVIDTRPRAWTSRDRDVLADIAASAMTAVELRQELEQRRQAETALETVALGTASAISGPAFFQALVQHLASALGARFAFTGELVAGDRARTLAYWADGALVPDVEYALQGTPCEQVRSLDLCYFPEDVRRTFPHDEYLAALGVESYMGMPVRDATGAPIGLIGVMHDRPLAQPDAAMSVLRIFAARVSAEMQRAEAERAQQAARDALLASEERFRKLVENTGELITVTDEAGRITYASPTWTKQRGIAPESLIGVAALDLVHPDDVARVRGMFRELVSTPGASMRTEYRSRHADGSWRIVIAVGGNLLQEPAVRGIVINSRDVTEQRIVEEQLRQAQKMEAVGQLAGGVAHDFNNLLTVITLHAQFALEALPAGGAEHDDVREIAAAADRAANLTRQLLAFSRKQMLKPVVLDLSPLVAGITPMLRRLIGEDIEIVSRLTSECSRVVADAGQLEQVLVNLVVNARDAMPEGGRLVIETGTRELDARAALEIGDVSPGIYATLVVADTGCGMDRQTAARVFEPFFTTKEKGQGTGLGLSTAYGIVRQSGGAITVDSAVNRGTTFTIYLPCAPHSLDLADAPARSARAAPTGTVLVVEDDDAVRRLAGRVLEQRGYAVLEACTGREAVDLLGVHQGALDLVLSDAVMPDMGGRALREWLAVARPDVPMLLMTGYTDDEIIRRGVRELSGDAALPLIQKPFTSETLVAAVRDVIERRKAGVIA